MIFRLELHKKCLSPDFYIFSRLSKKQCNDPFSQAPLVQNNVVQELEVEVQGDTFHSKELKKVMIKVYKPMTFVQTDKPIYLPGQTGNFEQMM